MMHTPYMPPVSFELVAPDDAATHALLADWYRQEWQIPEQVTAQKLSQLQHDQVPFQGLVKLAEEPIATGGIYHQVRLLEREPRLKQYPHWLALVYTVPAYRGKGYGAQLCRHLEQCARLFGLQEICLFTNTAESLYTRLGWHLLERLPFEEREVVVMKKTLS